MADSDFGMGYALGADSASNSGNGFFGNGDGIWAFLLFAMIFNGGWGGFGGFGGFGGGGAGLQGMATRADINEGFALNNITSGITAIQQGIADSTYALNNTLSNGFHGVDNAVCNLGYNVQSGFNGLSAQLAQCCCDNRAAIADVKYQMATDTCAVQNTIQNATRDIIDGQNAGTRAILDFLTQDKIATLTAENQSLKFAASQSQQNSYLAALADAQTAEILRRTGHECPIPAYWVQAPTPVSVPAYSGCCNSCC